MSHVPHYYSIVPRLQVAGLGKGDIASAFPDSSAETRTINTNPRPGAEGYEEWIKARAAAVGVPVALEKEREARCVFISCIVYRSNRGQYKTVVRCDDKDFTQS